MSSNLHWQDSSYGRKVMFRAPWYISSKQDDSIHPTLPTPSNTLGLCKWNHCSLCWYPSLPPLSSSPHLSLSFSPSVFPSHSLCLSPSLSYPLPLCLSVCLSVSLIFRFLLGRHKVALDAYSGALLMSPQDWVNLAHALLWTSSSAVVVNTVMCQVGFGL